MAPFVEANSLSDITQLASNPPRYPRNPTEDKRRSLTLYIARVPGTRDIILTTLRPQLKNVTAEDVASSLYYLHLNTNEDLKFLEEENARSDGPSNLPQAKLLPRKALPESVRSSLDLSRQTTNLSLNQEKQSTTVTKRKPIPVPENTSQLEPGKQSNETEQSPARRPLGPRPLKSEPFVGRKPLPGTENEVFDAVRPSPFRPVSPSRLKSDTETYLRPNSTADSKTEQSRSSTAYTITIIRRDPASGSQWNIGTIAGQPSAESQEFLAMNAPPSRKRPFDISVHLTTPGYGRFRDPPTAVHNVRAGAEAGKSTPSPKAGPKKDVSGQGAAPPPGFHRQIRMEGSGFWNRASVQSHKRTQSDMSVKQSTTRARSSSGSNAPLPNDDVDTVSGESQSKGYMFLSPWGGRCKFSTSSSGRALRCKHTLPDPVSASMTTDSSTPSRLSVCVSEIRFNLPTSVLFNSMASAVQKKSGVDTSRFSIPKFDNIRSKLSTHKEQPALPPRPAPSSFAAMYPSDDEEVPSLPPRPHRTSFTTESSGDETPSNSRRSHSRRPGVNMKSDGTDEETNDHMDLSLGQEKAGGGNRGKRAKLGKLIIHDEGFKMLDLVVAANMAVWWSVWESDFS